MIHVYLLENPIQCYEWGSPLWIPELTGLPNPDSRPMAELWMGAHPRAPSFALLEDSKVPLDILIAEAPQLYLGVKTAASFSGLPYLFKLLAAAKPLSIQAHPTLDQARKGWMEENAAGIPLDAPERNYKDSNHKPEILCALSDFTALCGFRPPQEILCLLGQFRAASLSGCRKALELPGEKGLHSFLRELFKLSREDLGRLCTHLQTQTSILERESPEYSSEWSLVKDFAELYPGDPAILAPLYLNLLQLAPGEGIFLPAGIFHAYVRGFGVELMANSDNVLRGGLTNKQVDPEELQRILNFTPFNPDILGPSTDFPDSYTYNTEVREFSLTRVQGKGKPYTMTVGTPTIVCVISGSVELQDGEGSSLSLAQGQSAFVSASAPAPTLKGNFTAYLASTGVL